MHMPSTDEMKDAAWRWRCKVLRTTDEKTLSDYSTAGDNSVTKDAKDASGSGSGSGSGSAPAASSVGNSLAVKTLYEGPMSDETHYQWTDYPPRQMSKGASRVHERVAMKLYKIKDKTKPVIGGRFIMKFHRLDVQNPLLVGVLAPLLHEREDMHLAADETATFYAPFRPLYFCYDSLVARLRGLQPEASASDAALQPYLKLLVCVLDDLFAEVRVKHRALAERGLLSFEHAWTFFPRHSVLRSRGHNTDVLSRVLDTAYVKSPMAMVLGAADDDSVPRERLVIDAQILRFNGEAFVWETQQFSIGPFAGSRPIADFDHCPLAHLPAAEQADLTARLTARGRRVLDCQGLAYCRYRGVGMAHSSELGTVEKHNVDCRVLVDIVGYNKHHLAQGARESKDGQTAKHVVPGTGRIVVSRPSAVVSASSFVPGAKINSGNNNNNNNSCHDTGHRNHHNRHNRYGDGMAAAHPEEDEANIPSRLTDEEQARNKATMLAQSDILKFMSPVVQGYALKNKMWFSFYVEDLRPMQWNDEAYDHLVYDEQQKDLVLSFVESHGHTTSRMDDVIIGKGDGLIILLSGPPGTGKTLTAEAVADRTHRPLFYLQAEDLGINAVALGANIKKVFEMATEWDAVVLLDEADVFMAERHPQDIARNELVSIFLRELEYFRGIIFLTTNLYDTIDSAFRSRVSLHLLFRPLPADARLAVWRKFLHRVKGVEIGVGDGGENENEGALVKGKGVDVDNTADDNAVDDADTDSTTTVAHRHAISEADLVELSTWNLNGREIKTAVKMVTTWCAHKGHAITLARLENGIHVTSPHASKSTLDHDDLYD